MLLGHNWVTNGSFFEGQVYYKSDVGISDYTAQESDRKWVIAEGVTTARKYHLRQTSAGFVTEFVGQSNGSIHCKGREEHKSQPQKSLNSEETIRPGIRMQSTQSSAIPVTMYEKAAASRLRTHITQMTRIFTYPCASVFSKFIFIEKIENHENHSN